MNEPAKFSAKIWFYMRIWCMSSYFFVREAADVSWPEQLWFSIEDISCGGISDPVSKLKDFFTLLVAEDGTCVFG